MRFSHYRTTNSFGSFCCPSMKLTVWAPFGASAASRYCASVRNRNSSARLCTAIREHKGNTAPTPSRFAEIVSDDFPILHVADSAFFPSHTNDEMVLQGERQRKLRWQHLHPRSFAQACS